MDAIFHLKIIRVFKLITDEPWKRYGLQAIGGILLFSILALLTGRLQSFFHGEDFFVFHWAETHNYVDAIKLWYLDNGRPINALYWISEYKVIGYRPEIVHFISFILHVFSIALASAAIFRVWPEQRRSPFLIIIFILTVFFFPHAMNWTLQLASDHIYLAQIFLFTSVLLVQQWAISRFKNRWLIIGFSFYVLAIFTYESTFLLFPMALLLTIPLLLPYTKIGGKSKIALLSGLALLSIFLGFIPIYFYSRLSESVHPAFYNNPNLLGQIPERIGNAVTFLYNYITDFEAYLVGINGTFASVLMLGILIVILTATFYMVKFLTTYRQASKTDLGKFSQPKVAMVAFYVLAIWLIIMSLLPYALGGFSAHPRLFSLPIYGFSLFLVLTFSLAASKLIRFLVVLISIFIVVTGLVEFYAYSQASLDVEFIPEMNYLSLTDAVPGVRENSVFLFVDFKLGLKPWNGCSLALQMLYDTRDLMCLYLSSSDPRMKATRTDTGLVADGGHDSTENWIIIGTKSDGTKYLIPEITPGSGLLIDWESIRPIETDYRRITPNGNITSQMYFKLLTRWENR